MIFLLGYLLTQMTPLSPPNHNSFSAENPDPKGIKALYLFYQVRGYRTELWKKNYQQLPKTSGDLIMIVGPEVDAPNKQELDALYNWIRRGNKVVLWAASGSDWANRFRFQGVSCLKSYKRKVYTTEKNKWFQRTKKVNWPSGRCISPNDDHEDVLVDDQSHVLMIKKRLGKGEIYYIPELEILTNEQIDQEDHMQLLLAIAELSSNTIWFDESVHPLPFQFNKSAEKQDSNESSVHNEKPPSVFSYLNLDGWLVLLQILLCVLLFLYQKGKRFAAPRKEWKKDKRNSLEYVEAMARWYQRSNLRKEVYDRFRNRLEKEIMEALRIPKDQFAQLGMEKINQYLGDEYQARYKKWAVLDQPKKMTPSFFLQATLEILRLREELKEWKNEKSMKVENRL